MFDNKTIFLLSFVLSIAFVARTEPPGPDPVPYAFQLSDGDRVAFLGDSLVEQEQWHGYLECWLTIRHPGKRILFRNLAWSGDTPTGKSRASFDWHKEESGWFELIRKPLLAFEPTVVVLGYGMTSSFDGEAGRDKFREDYLSLIARINESLSEAPPRLVLLGPIKHERGGKVLPDPQAHNVNVRRYAETVRLIADSRHLPFVDLYHRLVPESEERLTENGIHLNALGYARLAKAWARAMEEELPDGKLQLELNRARPEADSRITKATRDQLSFSHTFPTLPFPVPGSADSSWRLSVAGLAEGNYRLSIDDRPVIVASAAEWQTGIALERGPWFDRAEQLRATIVRKNELYFRRFRPHNQTYLFGFRKHEQGNNAVEIPAFDPLIEQEEKRIREMNSPAPVRFELVRTGDAAQPPQRPLLANPSYVRPDPANLTEQELPEFDLAEGLEISLYARNPLLRKPIHMNFDPQGRLWIASSSTYPQIEPGQEPEDSIIVVEDRDRDGQAETSTVFAHGLHIPTGVLPGDGGVYVAQNTLLLHLADTDGDGQADRRKVVLSGFGTEDTHHMLHTLRWGHDGQLYMNQSIYIHSHIETPHGVRRLNSAGVWHLRPQTLELEVFLRGLCNPWGHDFDRYGQSFLTDGAGSHGINYGVPGAMYFTYAGAARTLKSVSPGSYPKYCGLELVYSDHFPETWQGSAVANDFRAHRIVRFAIEEQGSGYAAQEQAELVRGRGKNFRPVDIKIGPDGALYVADWSNPIIQHGEVDFRDPRRDKVHGRIWRITYKDRPLTPFPELMKGTNRELLEQLLSPHRFVRQQAQRVLTERGTAILPQLHQWAATLNAEDDLLQALWMYQAIDVPQFELLTRLLETKDGRIRAAAVRTLRFWQNRTPNGRQLLTARLADEHPRVRLEAIRALAQNPDLATPGSLLEVLDRPMDRFLEYALWLSLNELTDQWLEAIDRGLWNPRGRTKQLEYALQAIPSQQASRLLTGLLAQLRGDSNGVWIELIGKAGGVAELETLLQELVLGRLDTAASIRAIQGLDDATRLRRLAPRPPAAATISALFDDPDASIQAGALKLAGKWKLHAYENRFMEKAGDSRTSQAARNAAIDALSDLDSDSAFQKLQDLLVKPHSAAIRLRLAQSLVSLDLEKAIRSLLWTLNKLDREDDLRTLWQAVLRQRNADRLIAEALRDQTLARPAAVVGMRAVRESGRNLTDLLLAIEKAGDLIPSGGAVAPERLRELVEQTRNQGDPDRGEAVYRREELGCVLCHAIGGIGGKVGPDLTSIGASAPVDYLIESLLAPNEKIKEGYHSLIVETNDGEEYSGTLVREDEAELILRNALNQTVSVPKVDIARRNVGGSLMPAGLIDGLDATQKLDLYRFLSRLGQPGRFDASQNNVVRQWRLQAGRHTDEQFGLERIVASPQGNRWKTAATLVDGKLPRTTMGEALRVRNINHATGLIALFAAATLQTARPGEVTLTFSAPAEARLWIDGKNRKFQPKVTVPLEAGTHHIILQLDPRTLPEFIRLESDEGTFLTD